MGEILAGLLLPLLGTSLGAACAFFVRKELNRNLQKALLGFAAGVMVASSVWSLLIPAIELSEDMGRLAFLPAIGGLALSFLLLLALDRYFPQLYPGDVREVEADRKRMNLLMLAVTLHNIPEGMAVGAVFSGLLAARAGITLAGAFALSFGIAIQNFPEGAIISLPLARDAQAAGARSAWALRPAWWSRLPERL